MTAVWLRMACVFWVKVALAVVKVGLKVNNGINNCS